MTQPDNPAAELPQPRVRVLSDSPEFVDVAFDECQKLAESHYENFSVVTRLVRKELRKHYYSVYAFSRGVDDLGDEFPGNRLAMLDLWEEQLNLCYDGEPSHIYFSALQATIREFDIPKGPFVNLIEANRKDQEAQSYENIDGVLDYCVYSANPVGRILLYLSGYREPSVQELSDKTCTALQLANFWQDVSRDYVIGRIYVPQDELNQFGVAEAQLASPVASESFRKLLHFQVQRTRQMFQEGYALVDELDDSLKTTFSLFVRGGLRILREIEKRDFDVLSKRPTVSKFAKTQILMSTLIRSKLGRDLVPVSEFKSKSKRIS